MRPSQRRLLDEIRRNLGPALGVRQVRRGSLSVAYEACLFSTAWDAAKSIGASTELRDRAGLATQVLMRPGPSEVTTKTANYTHLLVRKGSLDVEVHQGIYLTGLSSQRHQADLCLLPAKEVRAAFSPKPPLRPRASKLYFAIEAKCYATSVGLNVGRSFIGLRADLASRVALVTSAVPGSDAALIKRHSQGVDVFFHDAAPGRAPWDEIRRVLALHFRHA